MMIFCPKPRHTNFEDTSIATLAKKKRSGADLAQKDQANSMQSSFRHGCCMLQPSNLSFVPRLRRVQTMNTIARTEATKTAPAPTPARNTVLARCNIRRVASMWINSGSVGTKAASEELKAFMALESMSRQHFVGEVSTLKSVGV